MFRHRRQMSNSPDAFRALTVSPFISERPTLFCRYGIMFLMIVAHGTDVSGSYGGHTEAVEATQRL